MNTRAMLATLNDLDEQLCSVFDISRSGNATTLEEAITMSAATTVRAATIASPAPTPRRRSAIVP